MHYKVVQLSGWGNYPVVKARVYRPERLRDFAHMGKEIHWIPRGLGRSYGDASLNPHGGTLWMRRINCFLDFEPESGVLYAEAGVSFEEILRVFVPRGWFLPVTPGTKYVTLGGAIAADIHGKNHHVHGSLYNYIEALELILPSGEKIFCSRKQDRDIFEATIGGNGLTGVILAAYLRLIPIETSYIRQAVFKTANLQETLQILSQLDQEYPFSVAWVDGFSRGKRLGRAIVQFGRFAKQNELDGRWRNHPLRIHPSPTISIPAYGVNLLLNKLTVRAFNNSHYAFCKPRESTVHYNEFFYPLDCIAHWNRLYGRRGFLQWQCVVPPDAGEKTLTAIFQFSHEQGWFPYLAVLKRMGSGRGWLSFPVEGFTLALDYPNRSGIEAFISRLNELVLNAGGRIYLTKDAVLTKSVFEQMYPELDRWKGVKRAVDPNNVFASLQAQRLGLIN